METKHPKYPSFYKHHLIFFLPLQELLKKTTPIKGGGSMTGSHVEWKALLERIRDEFGGSFSEDLVDVKVEPALKTRLSAFLKIRAGESF